MNITICENIFKKKKCSVGAGFTCNSGKEHCSTLHAVVVLESYYRKRLSACGESMHFLPGLGFPRSQLSTGSVKSKYNENLKFRHLI